VRSWGFPNSQLLTPNSSLTPKKLPEQSKLPQRHPQEKVDRLIVDRLLESDPQEPMALAELARLRIRYNGFPGATDIKANLDRLLIEWHLTEEQLFTKTRELHSTVPIYQVKAKKYQEQEDWN
jgi:Protein of unknown function (DUF3288)